MTDAKGKPTVCPICRRDTAGTVVWKNAKGKSYCETCHRDRVMPARRQRTASQVREDILLRKGQELRDALARRDLYVRQAEAIREGYRAEVRAEVVGDIQRMSVWGRLKFCFNPFRAGST